MTVRPALAGPGSGDAKRHVGILGIGDDEVASGGGTGAKAGNLFVESFRGGHRELGR
jgi:hypothetical protein